MLKSALPLMTFGIPLFWRLYHLSALHYRFVMVLISEYYADVIQWW